jgi:hypothetical protein
MIDWLCDKCYNVTAGLRNCWRYLPLIWRDRDFDFSYLLSLMETKLRRMSVAIGDEGHLVKADRSGKQLRICAELCRRINEDRYFLNTYQCEDNWSSASDAQRRRWAEMAWRNRQNDVDYLCLMMRKHLLSWWD